MAECSLYHICRLADKGNLEKGYVGISADPEGRFRKHKSRHINPHLGNALKSYDDIVHYVVYEGTRVECINLEILWRPSPDIGWNCNTGGDYPVWSEESKKRLSETKLKPEYSIPQSNRMKGNTINKGRKLSDERKKEISEQHLGKKHHKYKGYLIKGVLYERAVEAAKVLGCHKNSVCRMARSDKYPEVVFHSDW